MIYLVIMVAVAAAGITRLWLQQRRESARMNTVDGFRESLERISSQQGHRTERVVNRSSTRPGMRTTGRPQPMDPARRAAAKRRIEARRRARQRVA